MPRARKTDSFDDFAAIFARLPWWVPVALAAAAWFGGPPLGRRLVASPAWDDLWPIAAGVLALFFVLTGITAQFEKAKRRRLIREADSLGALRAMPWREFEELCAEAYRRQGFRVEPTARGADGGVDLILHRNGGRVFVQCKRYAARQVDVRRVRELFGVMAAEGATEGVIVSCGTFTSAARQFARGRKLALVDGAGLLQLIGRRP